MKVVYFKLFRLNFLETVACALVVGVLWSRNMDWSVVNGQCAGLKRNPSVPRSVFGISVFFTLDWQIQQGLLEHCCLV